jgi:hypothetical protein
LLKHFQNLSQLGRPYSAAGVKRETTSDANGRYAFSLVPPGTYHLDTEKAGFGKATAEGVDVRITETSQSG